jgi:hypothetical protein
MQEYHIGDLVVAGLDEPVSKTSAAIGIVVDKVPRDAFGSSPDTAPADMLYVMWPDGTTRTRWGYQVLPLEE